MALVPQIANLAPFKRRTHSLFHGVQIPLSGHLRRSMPDILSSVTRWTSAEIPAPPPQRLYSIGPLGTAHQALSLPYPHNASLDSSVFEPPNPGPQPSLPSLPSLIRQRRFNEAARVRLMMVSAGIPIEPSWEYEKMAFRMLIPSLNRFNKARLNSFFAWWSLVPEQRQTIGSPTSAIFRRQYLHRIITWLCRLDGPDCPTSGLIRFGITAASKGYAPHIAERLIPHIILWTHPALSAKFLLDFVKAHEAFAGSSSQPRLWLMQAIETQMHTGRDTAATALLVAVCHELGVPLPSRLLCGYPGFVPKRTTTCDDAKETQQTENSTTIDSPAQASSKINRSANNIYHRAQLRRRSALRRTFVLSTPRHRHTLKRFPPRSSRVRPVYSASRVDHLAVLQVVHHLRSRNDPSAAFLHFKSNFETLNIIPPSLANMLNTLEDKHALVASRVKSRSDGQGQNPVEFAHQNPRRCRRWPSAYGSSSLWQIALSARKTISIDFDGLYQLFLQHASQRMASLNWQRLYKGWAVEDLRRIHSKTPNRPGRINIYTPWCPPKYAPSVHEFNAFLWGCTGSKDLSGTGSLTPSAALERVEHILKDMELVGVQPDRYSLGQLSKACASAGRWRKLVATLDRMHRAGMLKWGQADHATKRRARWVSADNVQQGGTKPFLLALAGRLERAGLHRRSKLLQRWADEGKYD